MIDLRRQNDRRSPDGAVERIKFDIRKRTIDLVDRFNDGTSPKKEREFLAMRELLRESLGIVEDDVLDTIAKKFGFADGASYHKAALEAADDNERSPSEIAMSFMLPDNIGAVQAELKQTLSNISPAINKKLQAIDTYAKVIIELFREVSIDTTTGLPRDEAFILERLSMDIKYMEQVCEADEGLLLVLIDIDKLKEMNDNPAIGHSGANHTLRAFGEAMLDKLRGDLVARLHDKGDEFVIVFKSVAKNNIDGILERLLRDIINQVPILSKEGQPIHERTLSASVAADFIPISDGIAALENGKLHDLFKDGIKRTDSTLQVVKLTGRNNYRVHSPEDIDSFISERQTVIDSAMRALTPQLQRIKEMDEAVGQGAEDRLRKLLEELFEQASNK